MNQKGIAHLLLLIILLMGVIIGVYLASHPAIFKPKASQEVPAYATGEYGSTPLDQLARYPRPASKINTMIYLIFNESIFADNNKDLFKDEMDYVWFDQSSLAGCLNNNSPPCSFSEFYRAVRYLKGLNPTIKTGVHAGGALSMAFYHLPHASLDDTDFLHNKNGHFYQDTRGYLNLLNPATRAKIAAFWGNLFANTLPELTGINIDGFGAAPAYPDCDTTTALGCDNPQAWIGAQRELSGEIHASVSAKLAQKGLPYDKEITYNGLFYVGPSMRSEFIDIHDGVLVEHPHDMITGAPVFRRYLETITSITQLNKKVFFFVQPRISPDNENFLNCDNGAGTTRKCGFLEQQHIDIDLNLERFFLASYLLLQKKPYTYFGYHPGLVYNGTGALYFYRDWNMDYGDPQGSYQESKGVYSRSYSNGIAVVNPTDQSISFSLPTGSFRAWDKDNGAIQTGSVNIPPRAGVFYFNAHISTDSGNYIYQILSTGQSLSLGWDGAPALTTTQPFHNLMLDDPLDPNDPNFNDSSLQYHFVPLIEGSSSDGPKVFESPWSAMANWVTANMPANNYQLLVTKHGMGAINYVGLKKGTVPYNKGLNQVKIAGSNAAQLGKGHKVTALSVVHGESDAGIPISAFETDLVEWINDYNNDVKAITHQTDSFPMFTDQMSYVAANSTLAQLAAAEDNPGKIYLVGPKYQFQYGGGVHMTTASYRRLGEYYGKVYKKVIIDHQDWKPLSPREITRNSNIVTVKFNVPVPPIQIDTSQVLEKAHDGFEFAQDGGNHPAITNVSIIGPDSLQITLSEAPTGTNQRLRYAMSSVTGSRAGADQPGSPRGNLRDSDPATSLYGNHLENWLVIFEKPVILKTGPSPSVSAALTYSPLPSYSLPPTPLPVSSPAAQPAVSPSAQISSSPGLAFQQAQLNNQTKVSQTSPAPSKSPSTPGLAFQQAQLNSQKQKLETILLTPSPTPILTPTPSSTPSPKNTGGFLSPVANFFRNLGSAIHNFLTRSFVAR